MSHAILSVVLAVSVISCPFLCGKGSHCCVAAASTTRAHSCCDGECPLEESSPADQHSPRQHDHSRAPDKNNCICGGAVVESSHALQLDDLPCAWLVPTDAVSTAAVVERLQQVEYRTPIPNDGQNLGRVLRCLMMSYLC